MLDSVRALERELNARLEAALGSPEQNSSGAPLLPRHPRARVLILTRLIPEALETSCDVRLERVAGTEAAAILRVPFRSDSSGSERGSGGGILRKWISRFQVWPFLEQFAIDAVGEILSELEGSPDLIIGNYSDGELVATLLSSRFAAADGTGAGSQQPSSLRRGRRRHHAPTQCNIAHALESNKYRDAMVRWREYGPRYNFETMFTSDLISASRADFIVTSTQQEVAGKEDATGQYEAALSAFTLPGLYRCVSGIDVFDPRLNIVSPACDGDVYYSFSESKKRLTSLQPALKALMFGDGGGSGAAVPGRGRISEERRHLPVLFTMARLDRVKNLVGLAQWFSGSERLRNACNLLIIGGDTDQGCCDGGGGDKNSHRRRRRQKKSDEEEEEEDEPSRLAREMHSLFDSRQLPEGAARWVSSQSNPVSNGELYRVVADGRGAFVQCALFENFGLTCVEAMASGLPTFATKHGGPSELIKHGINGFHIDPYHGEEAANVIAEFFEKSKNSRGKGTGSEVEVFSRCRRRRRRRRRRKKRRQKLERARRRPLEPDQRRGP